MVFEEIRQRSDVLGTPIITLDTGKKLGFVSQLWVDIDQQAVVALSLRPSIFYGKPQTILFGSVQQQLERVILVANDDAINDIDVDSYSSLINNEVVTETGELLGRVRGFRFDINNGKVASLILASIGLPFIPDRVVSTYELFVDEVVSHDPNRLVVFEGAKEGLLQLSVGVLERLGIGSPPWERDEDDTWTDGRGILGDWDNPAGGAAPSPRPRYPVPTPISNDTAAMPD